MTLRNGRKRNAQPVTGPLLQRWQHTILLTFIVLAALSSALAPWSVAQESPKPTHPANRSWDIAVASQDLSWLPLASADSFEVQVSKRGNFSDTVVLVSGVVDSKAQIPPLDFQTLYFWRVRGFFGGSPGPWSERQMFRTEFPLYAQVLLVRVSNAEDTVISQVSISLEDRWSGNYLNSSVKLIDPDSIAVFTEEDLPNLFYFGDWRVRRINLISPDGNKCRGHVKFDYTFKANFPSSAPTEVFVRAHTDVGNNFFEYPNWDYYSRFDEFPVTGLVPPRGKIRQVNVAAEPLLLVHGWGSTDWGDVPNQTTNIFRDTWRFLYPYEGPADTSARLLYRTLIELSALYGGKKVAIVAHGTGGLVVRTHIQSDTFAQNVSKVLMLGTPHFGSSFFTKLTRGGELIDDASVGLVSQSNPFAPILRQASLGSDFLFRLNSSPPKVLAPGLDPRLSYFCVGGTAPMFFGVAHTEIPGQDDGIVSAASASLLNFNIPFGSVPFSHLPLARTRLNLLQHSGLVINGFLDPTYRLSDLTPILSQALLGYWQGSNRLLKQDNALITGSTTVQLRMPGFENEFIAVMPSSNPPRLTLTPTLRARPDGRFFLKRVLQDSVYSSFDADSIGSIGWNLPAIDHELRFASNITMTTNPFESAPTSIERVVPVPGDPRTLAIRRVEGLQDTASGKNRILTRWMSAVEKRQQEEVFDVEGRPQSRDTVWFRIDPYMDTLLIVMATQSTNVSAGFENNEFELIAPNGQLFTRRGPDGEVLTPQYDDGGYESFPADGVAYYYMAKPRSGFWRLVYNSTAQRVGFVLSYLTDVYVNVNVPDSIFKPGDTVRYTVEIPRVFFTNPSLTTSLRRPLSQSDQVLNPQIGANAYEYNGSFVVDQVGVYTIGAEFTCQFPAGPVTRVARKQIEVFQALPPAPVLVSPEEFEQNVPRLTSLIWRRTPNATSYRVQLTTRPFFDSMVVEELRVTDTILRLPRLAPGQKYYWRVRASNIRGNSLWANARLFETGTFNLQAPSLVSPAQDQQILQRDTVLTWTSPLSSALYHVQLSVDTSFSPGPTLSQDTVSGLSWQVSLRDARRYFWRVRAVSPDGTSSWSRVWSFRRVQPAVQLIAPPDNSVGMPLAITFRWAKIADTNLRYRLQVSTRTDFLTFAVNAGQLSDTSFTVNLATHYARFFWRVRWEQGADTGQWSRVHVTETVLAAPTQDSPGNGVTGTSNSPTITWNPVRGADSYHLQISRSAFFESYVVNDSSIMGLSFSPGTLDSRSTFWWRVRAARPGSQSAWSSVWNFSTGGINSVESELFSQFQVFPNPATDELYVSVPESVSYQWLELVDGLGRIHVRVPDRQLKLIRIGLHDFEAGYYIVRLVGNDGMAQRGVVIRN